MNAIDPSRLPSVPSLAGDSIPATAAMMMNTYPGPALYVQGMRIIASNTAATLMLELAQNWWREAEPWLLQMKERGSRSPLTVRIPTDSGLIAVEWTGIQTAEGILLLGRNVTLEKNLHEVLTESRDRFRDLVELMADLAWEIKADGTFSYIAGGRSLGYQADDLLGKKARDFILRQPLEIVDYFDSQTPYTDKDIVFKRKDGSAARVLLSARPLFLSNGDWRGMRGVCRNVTEDKKHEEELANLQRRDRLIAQFVRSLRDAQASKPALTMAVREISTALVAAGCSVYTTTTKGEFVIAAESGGALPEIVHSHNRRLKENERKVIVETHSNAVFMGVPTVHGGHISGAIWVWRPTNMGVWNAIDQTLLLEVADHLGIAIAQFDYQEQLRILSECDGFTHLLNRRTFMEKLHQRLPLAPQSSALFYIDLDNFKAVNDTHGHQRGDLVIKRLADALHSIARPTDLAGRIGGDEFVLWMDNVSQTEAEAMAKKLVGLGQEMHALSASPEKPLGVSVGVAFTLPDPKRRASSLMELADSAMYEAKRGGKSDWVLKQIS